MAAPDRMKIFASAILLGTLIRIAVLPLSGGYDVIEGWSYVAAVHGVPRLYAWAAAPGDHRLRQIEGFNARGDYPPLALYELGLVGRIYRWASGATFPVTAALTAAVKAPGLLAEAALGLLLFVVVRRGVGMSEARQATLAFWLNPAMVLATGVFNSMDALFVLPAMGALVAGFAGRPALAGGLIAAAVLTKPQAIVVAPAVALAVWNAAPSDGLARLRSAVAGGALTSAAIVAPIAAAGGVGNMMLAVGNLVLGKDMLSNAFNLWWIVGHVGTVLQQPAADLASGVTTPAELVPISAFTNFDPLLARGIVRLLGSSMALGVIGWGLWTARRARDLHLVAAAGAFFVHAYVVLASQVHDNHLFAAIPLLALAAAGRPEFLRVFVALSGVLALNLNLLYGLGEEDLRYALPRMVTVIDATLIVSAANCVALVWHAAVLRRSCGWPGPRLQPGIPPHS